MRIVRDSLGRHIQSAQIIPVIVNGAAGRAPRQVLGSQHIAPPDLDGADAKLARHPIKQYFAGEIDLWLTITTIGSDRGLVAQRDIPANRLKNWSSRPKMIEGGRITAVGKCSRTACSPKALVRPYSLLESGSAPIAEI